MAKIQVQVTSPTYVELDPETEEICPDCWGRGEAPTMHVLIGPPPMGPCWKCNSTGVIKKKLPEPPPVKHDCEMAPGGSPCDNPGKFAFEDHWYCAGHFQSMINDKKATATKELAELRSMKKQLRDIK